MTLYQQFIETIQATQDKNIIFDNILKGIEYSIFEIKPIEDNLDSNSLKIIYVKNIRNIEYFSLNYIYIPTPSDNIHYINLFLKNYNCHVNKINDINYYMDTYIDIDITKSLKRIQNNKKLLNIHNVELPTIKTEKLSKFIQNYKLICEYLKENSTLTQPNYAYTLSFDYMGSFHSIYFKPPILKLVFVNPEYFKNYDHLFFIDKKELIKQNSGLFFADYDVALLINIFADYDDALLININKTIEKIELFNSLKNF